jgi:peroxiredoxin
MPFLQKLHEEWSDRGLVVLGINLGESAPRVERFAESKGLSFLMLLDTNQDVALRYNIRAIPTTFFIDKDGIIQDIRIGAISSEGEMERRLSKIIPWLERKGG